MRMEVSSRLFGFEFEIDRRAVFFDSGSLAVHFVRSSGNQPFSWQWSRKDAPPGVHSWHPTRTRTLNAAWRDFELVLDWIRPVPGTVGLNPNEPADGDHARVEREEREELAKYEEEYRATRQAAGRRRDEHSEDEESDR